MLFHKSVSKNQIEKIIKALKTITEYGNNKSKRIANYMLNNDLEVFIGEANEIGGRGCVLILKEKNIQNEINSISISIDKSSEFLRLCLAKELFEKDEKELEITLIHEGKHILDFAQMISTFSVGCKEKFFNPTQFQHEFSAYLISAKYILQSDETYINTGLKLGLIRKRADSFCINQKGILEFLEKNYRLSKAKQGYLLNEISDNLKPKKV